jgi:hypothetical protein
MVRRPHSPLASAALSSSDVLRSHPLPWLELISWADRGFLNSLCLSLLASPYNPTLPQLLLSPYHYICLSSQIHCGEAAPPSTSCPKIQVCPPDLTRSRSWLCQYMFASSSMSPPSLSIAHNSSQSPDLVSRRWWTLWGLKSQIDMQGRADFIWPLLQPCQCIILVTIWVLLSYLWGHRVRYPILPNMTHIPN